MKNLAGALFLFVILYSNQSVAQLRTAFAGGAHLASVPGNSSPAWDTLNYKYSSRTGFHFGLLADMPFSASSNFYFQPGIFFTHKGRRFTIPSDSNAATIREVKAIQYVNYVEIPLNVLYKKMIGKKTSLIVGGGPYVSFLFNGKERREITFTNGAIDFSENTDLKIPRAQGKYNDFDYGVNALLGVEFGRLFLTANYSQGFTNFYTPHTNTGTFKHQVMGATIGFYLYKGREKEKVKSEKQKSQEEQTSAENVVKPAKKLRDSDKDGVPDVEDPCPKIRGNASANGCPDADADGVPDLEDKCPELKGTKKTRGCPGTDSDKDGIRDESDPCPFEKGTKANNGCPDSTNKIIMSVKETGRKIQFSYLSTELNPKSLPILDEIVKVMNDNPLLHLMIEGHTSIDGNGKNHYRLSTARAMSVKRYLESKGISADRLKASGYGAAMPINNGNTEAERAVNRRVELKLYKP
jgi:OmpA-OmpF porin, OOP family